MATSFLRERFFSLDDRLYKYQLFLTTRKGLISRPFVVLESSVLDLDFGIEFRGFVDIAAHVWSLVSGVATGWTCPSHFLSEFVPETDAKIRRISTESGSLGVDHV